MLAGLPVALLLLVLVAAPARATGCAATAAVWGGFPALPRVSAALRETRMLRVVALGSSSTLGVGASARDRSYPAQLEALLRAAHPGRNVEVVNRGVGGETVAANLARLDRDVLALAPDLVIWQAGTNDALRGVPVATVRADLLAGIRRMRASGADVVLLGPQPVLDPAGEAALRRMEAVLIDVAQAAGITLLPRHALMRHWVASGQFTAQSLLGSDGLHMTDASYHCLAVRIADLFRTARAAGRRP